MAEPKKPPTVEDEYADLGAAAIADEYADLLRAPAPAPRATGATRAPARDPGVLSGLLSAGLQGFFKGGSDEAMGGLTRMRVDPGGGAAWRTPEGGTTPLATGWDVYRAARDTEREALRGAREARPKTTFAAELLGDLASDATLAALGVPGVGGRTYNVATGALSGLLGSDAELTPDTASEESVVQALAQAGLGGYAGKYGTALGETATRITPATLRAVRGWLERRGISLGRRALMSGSDQLARNLPVSDEAVREALESGAIVPFGTTQGAAARLGELADTRGAAYGEVLGELERLGVRGPDAEDLAQRLFAEGDEALRVAGGNEAVPREYWSNAEAILRKVQEPEAMDVLTRLRLAQMGVTPTISAPPTADASDAVFRAILDRKPTPKTQAQEALEALQRLRMAQSGVTPPQADATMVAAPAPQAMSAPRPVELPDLPARSPELPLSQAEGLKRTLQGEAKYGRIEDTPINEAKKRIASIVRQGIEERVEDAAMRAAPGSELETVAGGFQPVKERLARTLAAEEAAVKGAAAADKRAKFGLTDYLWMAGGGLGGLAGSDERGGAAGALASLLAHRTLRNRGPSTGASTAYWLSQLAGAGANAAAANPAMTRAAESLIASKVIGDLFASQTSPQRGQLTPEDRQALSTLLQQQGGIP